MAATLLTRIAIVALLFTVLGPAVALDRAHEPVIVRPGALGFLLGQDVSELGLFRFDPTSQAYEPIPFQLDEVVVEDIYPPQGGSPTPHEMVDVFGDDDGFLDDNDELVFMFADAGESAPTTTPFPGGASGLRYEIIVTDTRPGSPDGTRYAYLFVGTGLAQSTVEYVTWDETATGSIATEIFSLDYIGNWLLTGYRVAPPCGTGADLIDRYKGRAKVNLTGEGEDEEIWNLISSYLGGKVGPVRALRYVQGAASGTTTIHFDEVYRRYWKRNYALRVHPVDRVWLYIDWLPPAGTATYFAENVGAAGVPMDGSPDGLPTYGTPISWNLVGTPSGGLAQGHDIPTHPAAGTPISFYKDDVSYDDTVQANPGYGDDDDSAYGAGGPGMSTLGNSLMDPIFFGSQFYPLCGDEGDQALGLAFREILDAPFQVQVIDNGPGVGALHIDPDGSDVVLTWGVIPDATGYYVYRSEFVDVPRASWTRIGQTSGQTFRDVGVLTDGADHFYSVTAVGATGEGPH